MCVGQGGGSADPTYDRGYLPPLGLGFGNKKYFHLGHSLCLAKPLNSIDLAPNMPSHLSADPQTWKIRSTDDPLKPSPGATSSQPPHTLSRKQWRNRQKNKRRHKNKFRPPQQPDQAPATTPTEETELPPAPGPDSHEARAGALRARMAQRLDGARFRYLNEQLYSGTSSAAQRLFQEDPEAFLLYHRGFQSQVKKWPLQPVDRIARDLRQR